MTLDIRCAHIAVLALLSVSFATERVHAQHIGTHSDSAAVVTMVERYHRAMESADSAAALLLLTSDAVILESGGIETREQYRSHHLQADIAFARAVKSERGPIRVVVRGDVAWAASTSTAHGEFRGRAVNSVGAELMALTRTPDGWKISAIHWSSRNRRQ
jgi:ketosteroid isomerase-like protein